MNEQKVTHGQGVKLFWKNWANFSGRSTKSEFLHGFLFSLYTGIIYIVIAGILTVVAAGSAVSGAASTYNSATGKFSSSSPDFLNGLAGAGVILIIFGILSIAYAIAFGIPMLSLTIRRLRDAGLQTAWIVFAILIGAVSIVPFIGWLASLAFGICTLIICFARPSLPVNDKNYFEVLSGNTNTQPAQQQTAPQYAQPAQPAQPAQQAPVQPVAPAPAPEQPAYTTPTPPTGV